MRKRLSHIVRHPSRCNTVHTLHVKGIELIHLALDPHGVKYFRLCKNNQDLTHVGAPLCLDCTFNLIPPKSNHCPVWNYTIMWCRYFLSALYLNEGCVGVSDEPCGTPWFKHQICIKLCWEACKYLMLYPIWKMCKCSSSVNTKTGSMLQKLNTQWDMKKTTKEHKKYKETKTVKYWLEKQLWIHIISSEF